MNAREYQSSHRMRVGSKGNEARMSVPQRRSPGVMRLDVERIQSATCR